MSSFIVRSGATALLLLASATASAELRSFDVTGTVTSSSDPTVAVGSKIHAQFSYDDAMPDTSGGGIPGYGYYDQLPGFFGNYSGHRVDSDEVTATVWNDFSDASDLFQITGRPIMVDNKVLLDGVFVIVLQSVPYVNALQDNRLPASFDMNAWSTSITRSVGEVRRNTVDDSGAIVQFSIDAIDACDRQNGKTAKKICWSH
jgi:hypothetical protein